METVVKLAMVLVSLSFVLKLTGYKLRQLLLMALLCALFVGFSWQFAAEQSKTAIASWLSDRELMQDIAVLMTLDVALQMAYCLMAVNLMNSGPLKRRTILVYKLLRLFPGIMVFLVLFSLLVSAAVLVLLPLAVLGVRKLLPEKEIRLELLFLSNALTAALGVIATVNGTTASESVDSVDYHATIAVIGIVLLCAALGFLLYRLKAGRKWRD